MEFTVERNQALERLIGSPSSQDMELISMWQFELSIDYDQPAVHSECGREDCTGAAELSCSCPRA